MKVEIRQLEMVEGEAVVLFINGNRSSLQASFDGVSEWHIYFGTSYEGAVSTLEEAERVMILTAKEALTV